MIANPYNSACVCPTWKMLKGNKVMTKKVLAVKYVVTEVLRFSFLKNVFVSHLRN